MTTSGNLDGVARVIVGVDTHLDEHVAVAIDHHGARLGEYRLATTAKGYKGLESWAIIGLGGVALASKVRAHMEWGWLGTSQNVAIQSSR